MACTRSHSELVAQQGPEFRLCNSQPILSSLQCSMMTKLRTGLDPRWTHYLDSALPLSTDTNWSSFQWEHLGTLIAQLVKNLPVMRETWDPSLGWEDPLEKGAATHSSIMAWRIPWTVQSMRLQRVRHDWATFTFLFLGRKVTFTHFTSLWTLKMGVRRKMKLKDVLLFHQFLSTPQSVQSLSHVRLFAIPWIAARQASLLLLLSHFSCVRLCATP